MMYSKLPFLLDHLVITYFIFYFFPGRIYFAKGRKKPKVIVEGYEFHFERSIGNATFWSCPFYTKTRCKCRLKTMGHTVRLNDDHNHRPKPVDVLGCSSRTVFIVKTKNIRYSLPDLPVQL